MGCSEEDLDFHYKEIVNFLKPESHPNKFYQLREIEEVQEQLSGVNEAYRVLKDPKLRKEYDQSLKAPKKEPKQVPKKQQPKLQPVIVQAPRRVVEGQPVSRRRVKANKSFWQNVKDSYREVKIDERKNSFAKRHARMSQAFDETYQDKVTSLPKEILFHTGKGTAHVFLEGFYQLSRLSYINKDTVTKYVIRNRRLVALALALGIITSCGWFQPKKEEEAPVATKVVEIHVPDETEPVETTVEGEEPRLVLTRYYTIERGDTLSRLAYNANSSVEELKQINEYDSDKIYAGHKMIIPYTIDREDIDYYTETVYINDFSIEEIARAYETDVETIVQLNRGYIVYSNGEYHATTYYILVPVFYSKVEVQEIKDTKTATNH